MTHIDSEKVSFDETQRLLSWGSNNNGQLGLGFQSNSVSIPEEIHSILTSSNDIKKIVCSKNSSALLLSNGKLYTFGASRDGVLGHDYGLSAKNETIPRFVEGLEFENVKDVSIGDHHGAAINDKGELFAWGSLTHGKLGIAKSKVLHRARRVRDHGSGVQKTPKKIEFFGPGEDKIHAEKVLCTNQNTFIIGRCQIQFNPTDQKKNLYVLGSTKSGKSGIGRTRGNIETPTLVEGVKNVEQITCGRDFCLTLTENNRVDSWGANNFGQLGGYEHYSSSSPHVVRYLRDKKIVKVGRGSRTPSCDSH